LAVLWLSGNFILGRVTYCDLSIVMVDRSKETQMNLAWRFGDFVSQKLHRPELGEVSYHWAAGEQQGGYRNRLRKVFQPFTSCCLLQTDRLDPRALQKHLAISPIPLPFVAAP
jgi:hypothetical protein